MISEPNAINYLLSGALGAVISSIFLIINNQLTSLVNNKSQLEREEKQRIWQLEREEKQRIWQEENDKRKWYREKIYDSYKTSFQILVKIDQELMGYIAYKEVGNTVQENKHFYKTSELTLEFFCEFSIIVANHPNNKSKEFTEKINTINEALQQKSSLNIRDIIIEIMESDSRIKI
jgi:lipopolysaccharide export LptBFGC system permease protein LptF